MLRRSSSRRALAALFAGSLVVGAAPSGLAADAGALDVNFGNKGKLTLSRSITSEEPRVIARQSNGKIVVAGNGWDDGTGGSGFIARFKAGGAVDKSFGDGGVIKFPEVDGFTALAVDEEDRIVAAGIVPGNTGGTDWDIFITRYGAEGDLDTAFGDEGVKRINFDNDADYARELQIRKSDKKIIVGVQSQGTSSSVDYALLQLTDEGEPDPAFGGGDGKVKVQFPIPGDPGGSVRVDRLQGIALDGNKIVAAGSSAHSDFGADEFLIARFTESGDLDSQFGEGDGWTLHSVSQNGDDIAVDVDVTPDHRPIIGGRVTSDQGHSDSDIALLKFTEAGLPDTSFGGGDGVVVTKTPVKKAGWTMNEEVTDLVLDGQKPIVSGNINGYGTKGEGSSFEFFVMRYGASGGPMAAFGKNGLVRRSGKAAGTEHLLLVPGSPAKLVAAGGLWDGYQSDIGLTRFKLAEGTLDRTFGRGGVAIAGFGKLRVIGVALLPLAKGKSLLVAKSSIPGDEASAVLWMTRLTAGGRVDRTFGTQGWTGEEDVDFDYEFDDVADAVKLPDGKIMVLGSTSGDLALVRMKANGRRDESFADFGGMRHYFESGQFAPSDLDLVGNRFYVSGSVHGEEFTPRMAAAKLKLNGAVDNSWTGVGGEPPGRWVADYSGDPSYASSLVAQGEKVIVAGSTHPGLTGSDAQLVRITATGQTDESFANEAGNAPPTRGQPGRNNEAWYSVELVDGRIYVAGVTGETTTESTMSVGAYKSNGKPDTTFSGDGFLEVGFAGNSEAESLVFEGSKPILVGGADGNLAVARLTTGGKLDKTFSDDGKLTTDFGGIDRGVGGLVRGFKLTVFGRSEKGDARRAILARYRLTATR